MPPNPRSKEKANKCNTRDINLQERSTLTRSDISEHCFQTNEKGFVIPKSHCPSIGRIQNTQEIKKMLFNWTKQDKMCKFFRKSSLSSYTQHESKPQRIDLKYLVSVRCSEDGGNKILILCQLDAQRLVEGKCFLPPASKHLMTHDKLN